MVGTATSSVDLPASFERHQLDTFLTARGFGLATARREDLEAFLAGLLARWKPATAANRHRALPVFYAWPEDEGEIAADPMVKMKPPPGA